MKRRTAAALASLLFVVQARDGAAEPVDPAMPTVVTVGVPATPAPIDKLDRARRNRSKVELPEQFVEVQRKTVGSVAHPPIVHADGTLTLAMTSPEIVRVAKDGTEKSRVSLGSSPAVRAPVLLPSGSVAVVTSAPSVVFISDAGKITSTIVLPRTSFAVQSASQGFTEGLASIVPTEDGAVLVAANRSMIEIDASARVRLKVSLPERVSSDVLPHPQGGWLVVGDTGGVYLVRPPGDPRKLGTLGGLIPGTAALLDDRTIVAEAPPNRIVALDLKSGAAVTRVGDSIFSFFDSPFALDPSGGAWVTTGEGFLVGYDAAGAEIGRAAAERTALVPGLASLPPMRHGGTPLPMTVPRPPPVVDPKGRVAFARGNGRFAVRGVDGKVVSTDRACTSPLSIIPTAPKELVLVCRDGTLITFGEAPPP